MAEATIAFTPEQRDLAIRNVLKVDHDHRSRLPENLNEPLLLCICGDQFESADGVRRDYDAFWKHQALKRAEAAIAALRGEKT